MTRGSVGWAIAGRIAFMMVWLNAPRHREVSKMTLTESNGQVEWQGNQGQVKLLTAGESVTEGTLVSRGVGARARLTLPGGGSISLAEDTKLKIGSVDSSAFYLQSGSMVAEISHHSTDSPFEIRTPTAVAKVVRTKFVIGADEKETWLQVHGGNVAFHRLADGAAAMVVEDEEMRATANADQPLQTERSRKLPSQWRASPDGDRDVT